MKFRNKKCVPCKDGVLPIASNELEDYLYGVVGWKLVDDNSAIEKEFKFSNFKEALKFVNQVGEIAERENHHPDIEFGWGYCNIRLSTHSICGLHENDFIVASKIDGITDE